jgi:hypothetical protein
MSQQQDFVNINSLQPVRDAQGNDDMASSGLCHAGQALNPALGVEKGVFRMAKRRYAANTLEHKGYIRVTKYNDEAGIFHGEVINLRDVITFKGPVKTGVVKSLWTIKLGDLRWFSSFLNSLTFPVLSEP